MKEVNEIFDLVRLKDVSESRHSRATIVNLMLDFLFA
jgi:hypothetical protein